MSFQQKSGKIRKSPGDIQKFGSKTNSFKNYLITT